MTERVYTTVDVAKLCKVSLRTVIRWVDEGKLPSFRTPGGHRRVRENDLMQFMDRYKIPFSIGAKREAKKILIVDQKKKLQEMLQQILRRSSDVVEITMAKDLYESAVQIGMLRPDLVLVAANHKAQEIQRLLKAIGRIPETRETKIFLLSNPSSALKKQEFLSPAFHKVVTEPLTIENFRPLLLEILGSSSSR